MYAIKFTKEGYERLKDSYEKLLAQRPAAVEDLRKAREMGDLSENGFYKAARAKLSSIDSRLRRMSSQLDRATVVEAKSSGNVEIGTSVVVYDGTNQITYNIVGDTEADPVNGNISLYSPIGRALAGRKEGDEAAITIPAGTITYKIVRIVT